MTVYSCRCHEVSMTCCSRVSLALAQIALRMSSTSAHVVPDEAVVPVQKKRGRAGNDKVGAAKALKLAPATEGAEASDTNALLVDSKVVDVKVDDGSALLAPADYEAVVCGPVGEDFDAALQDLDTTAGEEEAVTAPTEATNQVCVCVRVCV